jgi:hypothetical protein
MSGACPFCGAAFEGDPPVCVSCGKSLLKPCPFCAEEIPVHAQECRWCASNLASPVGEAVRAPTRAGRGGDRLLVQERGIAAIVTLGFLTCGFYAFYVLHQQMREIQGHLGGLRRLEPTRDLILSIVAHVATLGMAPFWIYYVMVVYPRAYQEACLEEEMPCRDVLTPCLLVAVMSSSLFCFALLVPVWVISVAVLQNELNQHWRLHRRVTARAWAV